MRTNHDRATYIKRYLVAKVARRQHPQATAWRDSDEPIETLIADMIRSINELWDREESAEVWLKATLKGDNMPGEPAAIRNTRRDAHSSAARASRDVSELVADLRTLVGVEAYENWDYYQTPFAPSLDDAAKHASAHLGAYMVREAGVQAECFARSPEAVA